MQFTRTGNNVFTGFRSRDLHTRIGFGQAFEPFDEFREIDGVLDLNSDLHDRGDRELHDPHVMGAFRSGKGTGLQQELIDTDKTDDVTGRTILNGIDGATHHEHSALDGLDEEIVLFSRDVVGTLDADFWPGFDSSRKDTA